MKRRYRNVGGESEPIHAPAATQGTNRLGCINGPISGCAGSRSAWAKSGSGVSIGCVIAANFLEVESARFRLLLDAANAGTFFESELSSAPPPGKPARI
jgi:hypothetical protein